MAEQNKELDALRELERRIMTGDPAITPDVANKVKAKLEAYRAQGIIKPLGGGSEQPKLTEAQSKAVGFYENAVNANKDYETSFAQPGSTSQPPPRSYIGQKVHEVAPGLQNVLPSALGGNTPERQQADQAQLNFIMATLRQESGAAISPSEIQNQYKRYFPEPGDSDAAIQQKAKARQTAIDALRVSAGPGLSVKAVPIGQIGSGETVGVQVGGEQAPDMPRATPEQQKAFTDFVTQNRDVLTPDLLASWSKAHNMEPPANLDAYVKGVRESAKAGNAPNTEFSYEQNDQRIKDEARKRLEAAGTNTPLGAFATGAADTASLGFSDEAIAGIQSLVGNGTYGQNLQNVRAEQKVLAEDNPVSGFAGQLAGGLALPGGNARTPAEMAKVGGALGGIYGVGSGDTLESRFSGGLKGAAMGAGLGYGAGKLMQRFKGDVPPPSGGTPADVMRNAQDIGITNVLPADVGGPITRGLTAGARQGILSELPISATVNKAVSEGAAARDAAARMAGTALEPIDAGELARKAANVYSRDTSKTGSALYDRAYRRIGDLKVDLPNAQKALDDNIAELGQAIGGGNDPLVNQLRTLRDQIGSGQFSVQGIRMTRTRLRDQMLERGLRGSDTDRRLQSVIDAANQDVQNALVASGREDAAQALKTADEYWKRRVETIDEVLDPLLGKNAPRSGEQIFSTLQRMGNQKTGDAKRLSRLMGALDPQEANSIRASVIHQLGTPKPRAMGEAAEPFSFTEFVGRWDEMSPAAKDVLFQGPARVQLDKLVNVARSMKATSKYANTSNTARAIGVQAALSGAAGMVDMVTMGTMAAGQAITGLMLASPKVAKVLASARSFRTKPAYAAALVRAAGENPAVASDVSNFTQRLLAGMNDNIPVSSAASEGGAENKQ